jgi:hypothetical protein
LSNFITNHLGSIWNRFRQQISQRRKLILGALILLLVAGIGGYFIYYNSRPQYVLPPKFNTENQTYNIVISFIQSDNTDSIPYGEGFNCVDSVFRVWRNAVWKGIVGVPVAIQYDSPPAHMVIGFPTIDKGDIFIESENDQQIRLAVGQFYDGRKIRGFYALDVLCDPLGNSPQFDSDIAFK